jgi:outer membrane lipoprotein-sorting protein
VLDKATLQIRRLVTTDAQGGTSTFVFTQLRENVGLPDKAFAFTIPRGVDVITDGSRQR